MGYERTGSSPSVGCRCAGIEQSFALELAPEFDRDLRRQAGHILLHFGDAERSRDDRAHGRMEQGKLHGGRPQLNAVALAEPKPEADSAPPLVTITKVWSSTTVAETTSPAVIV